MIVPLRAFLYYLNKNIRGKSFHSPPPHRSLHVALASGRWRTTVVDCQLEHSYELLLGTKARRSLPARWLGGRAHQQALWLLPVPLTKRRRLAAAWPA